jgi:hypothetical protein
MAIIGVSSIVYFIYLTLRGVTGVGPPATQIPAYEVVGVLVAVVLASGIVFRLITPMLNRRVKSPKRGEERYLTPNIATALLLAIVGVQLVLVWAFANAYIMRNSRLLSLDLGLILLGLGMSQHIYATASKLPSSAKR